MDTIADIVDILLGIWVFFLLFSVPINIMFHGIESKKDESRKQLNKLIAEHKVLVENAAAAQLQQYKELERLETAIKQKCSSYPQLAGVMADLLTAHYEESAYYLEHKSHPARTEALRIRELKKETKQILKEKKELEYKMAYIQELFPNINDVFDSGFNEEEFELETEETTDRVRLFLSDDEYRKLSVTERNQLALDKYLANRKSKWQIGRDYEMYIGYLYEKKGYRIEYTGIIKKLEDMGRDLIARKGSDVLIIQCKNWSAEKTIHEKHIFQLFGTVTLFSLQTNKNVKGVFIASTKLSPTAKQVAEKLNITVVEDKPLGEFPRIKCNINRQDGEKIYHLPFDQQYDSAVIEEKRGEFLAMTVAEAEEKGFRRAFKHKIS